MIAANPVASTRAIRPLECREPMTFAMAGGVASALSAEPSTARSTSMPRLRCAGIGSSNERAIAVASMQDSLARSDSYSMSYASTPRFPR
jgi:hypothetical protein